MAVCGVIFSSVLTVIMAIFDKSLFFDFDIETYDKSNIEELLLAEIANLDDVTAKENEMKTVDVEPTTPPAPQTQLVDQVEIAQLAWVYKDAYEAYNHIEKHQQFAETLYFLNKRGHYIIDELKRTKIDGFGNKIDPLVDSVIYAIVSTVRARQIGTSTLMNELYFYLEEVLFHDAVSIEEFYIDEDAYPLTAIYYGQERWIVDIDTQPFSFVRHPKLEEGELMLLACYFNDYLALLERITDHIESTGAPRTESHKRLEYTMSRVSVLIDRVKQHLMRQIEEIFMASQ